MRFHLGLAKLSHVKRVCVPFYVSVQVLERAVALPRVSVPWGLDSEGFTSITKHGRFLRSPREYAATVRRLHDEMGNLEHASTQDWMCEDVALARTGLTVREHQLRSVRSFVELRDIDPGLPWMPALQGRELGDYLRCAHIYAAAGVDVTRLPRVGVGSVCRRQGTEEGAAIVMGIAEELGAIRIHAFGFKIAGLRRVASRVASADSMAWSVRARNSLPMVGCGHASCANCLRFAEAWRDIVVADPAIARWSSERPFSSPVRLPPKRDGRKAAMIAAGQGELWA